MTLPEFLAVLARAPFEWSFRDGVLRAGDRWGHCPVTAVCEVVTGEVFDSICAPDAGDRLGLPRQLTWDVMSASDTRWRYCDDLRRQIFAATRVASEVA